MVDFVNYIKTAIHRWALLLLLSFPILASLNIIFIFQFVLIIIHYPSVSFRRSIAGAICRIRPRLSISLITDMDNPSFVTLAAGGMQPESSPGSSQNSVSPSVSDTRASHRTSHCLIFNLAGNIESKLGVSPASSLSVSTHDTSRTRYHIADVEICAQKIEQVRINS